MIDIHDPLTEICGRLGLEPEFVRAFLITPVTVTAIVYPKDESGHKSPLLEAVAQEFEVKT